ncbi:MAG TPA: lipopolysaccharide biosynthesis protein, partial [Burkholderiaceae bacterium]|nr:lipopolysaccharide biosynthesis protein [Burkholderiaceae bacterium]
MKFSVPTFWKHVITVLSGTVAAQALPLLVAPLITRLCTPEGMGTFGVWWGIISIASIAATLRLDTAMILDHGSSEQQTCFSVVAWSATVLALILTLLAVTARTLGLPQALHMPWFGLLTIGIGMWLVAYMQTMLAYATSYRAFGKAARAKIWAAGSIAMGQLSLLAIGMNGGVSLMAGQITGLAIGVIAGIHFLSPPRTNLSLKLDAIQRTYLMKHQAFWRFALPAELLDVIGGQFPLFMIGAKYGVFYAGLFALTSRVMAAPISLLAASVQEVFKRESIHDFQTIGNCKNTYERTFKALFLLGCVPFLFILIFAPSFFSWIFGEPWREAGEFARIMAPLYFLNFIASPLSYVFYASGKQKINLIWHIALFLMTICIFLLPLNLKESLWTYTIGYSFLYV